MFLLYILALAAGLAVLYVRRHYTYWQRRGFPYDKHSEIPFGCLKSVSKHEKSMGMAIHDVYLRCNEPFVGVYLLFRPALLVRDVTLVRQVLAQDFASFHDRGIYVDEENDPISAHIFAMRGQSWRTLRNKLAPSFTSGKLKGMFGTSMDIGNKMVDYLNTQLPESGSVEIDVKDVTTNYAIDIIASVIFGLETNSFDNPTNTFKQLITKQRRNTFFSAIFGMLIFLCPPVAKFLVRLGFKNEVGLSFHEIIKDTIQQREQHNIVRRDMLQLLMQLRNTGRINEDDSNWTAQSTAEQFKSMSIESISAQAFIFLLAGQETTASTASLTIFELAQYEDLLQRAQQEVHDTLQRHGGEITYEALQEMEFVELCILETLRKYPGLPLLNRECTQDYTIPGTDKTIQKGTPIVISLFGIHRNAEYFPEPENYNPERFLAPDRLYNPNAYMPFGEGPRHCIAQRMGKINAKLAVVRILQNFNIEITPRREIEIDNHSIAIIAKGGIKVRLSKKAAK